LFQTLMEYMGVLAIIGGVFSFFAVTYGFLKSNHPRIKRIRYYISNKAIRNNINAARDYPIFKPDMPSLGRTLAESFRKDNRPAKVEAVGENYIIIFIEGLQGPFKVEFQPRISDGYSDEQQHDGAETIDGTEVRVRLVGTIKFYYREDENNKDYLNLIQTIFEFIEQQYKVKSEYTSYRLTSTSLDSFDYDWSKSEMIKDNGVKVVIGKTMLDLNSTSVVPLYDVFKKHITKV